MKAPRRRFWIPLAVLLIWLVGAYFGLDYHLVGLLRGDAYYQGMPTSYWHDVATHQYQEQNGKGVSPSWLEQVKSLVRWRARRRGPDTLFKRDPAAQAVLLQLALDADAAHYLRVRALESCAGPPLSGDDRATVDRYLDDPDRNLRHAAAAILVRLNQSESALERLLGELKRELRDPSLARHQRASWSLWKLASDTPSLAISDLEKHITPMLKDEDPEVRERAGAILASFQVVRKMRE